MSGDIARKTGAASQVQIFDTVADLRACVAKWRAGGHTVAVVPTMGFLHRAHVAMIAAAQARCDRVIVTIFVNPKQFGENEDFDTYPRDLDGDIAKLREAGADVAFVPRASEMYPAGFSTSVLVAGLTDSLCGASRPGHFDGVSTVVTKLLLQCQADDAMFGEKDYQQLQVVRRMARDLDIPVRICPVPTVREDDGLAISSRNVKLSAAQRAIAPAIYRELRAAAARIAGGSSIAEAEAAGREALNQAGFDQVDYFEARDAETLAPMVNLDRQARVFAAAWLGEARLIDNIAIGDA